MRIVTDDAEEVVIRRSLLWVSGISVDTLEAVLSANGHNADLVSFDLEDTVPPAHKVQARQSVVQVLRSAGLMDRGSVIRPEIAVRVNGPGPVGATWFEEDLVRVTECAPDIIRLPKIDGPDDVVRADKLISSSESAAGLRPGHVKLVAHIENPRALRLAYEIATAAPRVVGLVISGEDYTESILAQRHTRGPEFELAYARGKVLVDARAAGIQAFDSVFMDTGDDEGFDAESQMAREYGFDGKNCLTAAQVEIANRIFGPTEDEVDQARRVVELYDTAIRDRNPADYVATGTGVLPYLEDALIGPPVALKARRVLEIADAIAASSR